MPARCLAKTSPAQRNSVGWFREQSPGGNLVAARTFRAVGRAVGLWLVRIGRENVFQLAALRRPRHDQRAARHSLKMLIHHGRRALGIARSKRGDDRTMLV